MASSMVHFSFFRMRYRPVLPGFSPSAVSCLLTRGTLHCRTGDQRTCRCL